MLKREEAADPNSCWNRAHPDEPVFVFLGRDKSAATAIRAWIHHRLITAKSTEKSPEIIDARRFVEVMEKFAAARGKERL